MTHKTGLLILLMAFGFLSVPFSAANADDWRGGRGHHEQEEWGEYGRGRPEYHHDNGWGRYHQHRERVVYYYPTYHDGPVGYRGFYYSSYGPWDAYNPGVRAGVPFYRVGEILPRSARLRCHEPDRHIVAVLPPVRPGTRYVQVDNDVYLIAEATKHILDAVVLASAAR